VAYKLIVDGAALETLLHSPDGALGRWMIGRAQVVQNAARIQCPKRTNKLSESIVKRFFDSPDGLNVVIAAQQPYAIFVHEGTKAHVITGNPILAFAWEHGPNGPGTYFFRSVHHPGTKPNRFLADNLRLFNAL
jgi:hypothetical protein